MLAAAAALGLEEAAVTLQHSSRRTELRQLHRPPQLGRRLRRLQCHMVALSVAAP